MGETRGDHGDLCLARGREYDGVRAGVGGTGLPCGVHALCGEKSYWEIPSDNHIVGDGIGRRSERYVSRFSVAGCWTWLGRYPRTEGLSRSPMSFETDQAEFCDGAHQTPFGGETIFPEGAATDLGEGPEIDERVRSVFDLALALEKARSARFGHPWTDG